MRISSDAGAPNVSEGGDTARRSLAGSFAASSCCLFALLVEDSRALRGLATCMGLEPQRTLTYPAVL